MNIFAGVSDEQIFSRDFNAGCADLISLAFDLLRHQDAVEQRTYSQSLDLPNRSVRALPIGGQIYLAQ